MASIVAFIISLSIIVTLPTYAEETLESPDEIQTELKTCTGFSYNIQKYSGFSFVTEKFTEQLIKFYLKFKTKSKKTIVDLDSYSGLDLLRKKVKSATIKSDDLKIKEIPIKHFEMEIQDPIYIKKIALKKKKKKKNRLVLPVSIKSEVIVDLNNINDVINNIPKWKKNLGEVDLPVPPFGTTKVEISNLKINAEGGGHVNVSLRVTSKESPNSEPLDLAFTGNIALKDKKIIIENLESEAKDIFTKDSDLEKSFSSFLEDLVNPVFNLSKYEKKGFTIEDVKLNFDSNNLILNIYAKKNPQNFNSK